MVALLTADAPGLAALFGPQQWGIFSQAGAPILTVDSVASIEYARDYQLSDYPQEQGAFYTYNKVQRPFLAKIGFLVGPSRAAFLNTVEGAVASLDLVSIVTPEIQYPSANLVHYGFRREARNGKTLIRVDVWAEEVRILPGNPPDNAQSTNAATPTQSGQVQPQGTVTMSPLLIGEPDSGVAPNPPLDPPT